VNILHIVQAYYPAIGGSEGLTRGLSEHLVSRYGDQVTVFTANVYKPEAFWKTRGPLLPPGVETINGVTVRRLKIFNGLQLLRRLFAQGSYRLRLPYNDWLRTIQTGPLIPGIVQAIADSGAQVVFSTAFPFMHMYYALAGARRAGIPVVLLGAIHFPDEWNYGRPMIYRAIQRADAYVAHTTYERERLTQLGIPGPKIAVIGPGVDANALGRARGDRIRAQCRLGSGPVIGALARQSPLKRLDTLLQAMPRVWASRPDARLVLAGARTSYSPALEAIIAELPPKRQEQITVIGDFSEEDKGEILAACDLVVHPSGNESFGIVFIEAWACARPVVGARIGAIPSVIDEGRDGLLFEYLSPDSMARTILELLDSPSRRKEMGKAGRTKVLEHYTWEIVTEKLRRVYLELTEEGQPAPYPPFARSK
jgi:glycosyltransferase involved in cell wall biosynthesis